MTKSADVVIVGAGIAGVSTAYELAINRGLSNVAIADPRPPLSLTSDKSTESYRNWWPDAPMVGLMNRSIDLLGGLAEASNNAFGMNTRGYLFVTAEENTLTALADRADNTAALGAAAEVLDREELRNSYPYLSRDAVGAVRVPRAGWFDAQQLGAWMLEQARSVGVKLIRDEIRSIHTMGDAVTGVTLRDLGDIWSPVVVNAAGPMAAEVASLAGVELPLHSELHLKVVFKDHLGAVPRDAPMLIWSDPQRVDWSNEEREALAESGRIDLLDELPLFCHGRPEGGQDSPYMVGLWEYDRTVMDPTWPIPVDELYAEVVIRGLSRMIPALSAYREALPETMVDGGYYTKTSENRPLIGPVGPAGFHTIVGLSGFGVMVAAGAADLLADHITGADPPEYNAAFLLSRYSDTSYLAELDDRDSGQL